MYITLTQRSERLRIIKQKPSVLTLLHLQILLVSFVLAITYLAVTTDAHAEARIEESAPRIAFLIPPAERFDGFARPNVADTAAEAACLFKILASSACSPGVRATAASGITADRAAALVVALQTNETSEPLALTINNEATLVIYDPDYRNYPPLAGSQTLTIQPSQFSSCDGQPCVLAIVQAPDVEKVGPGGGYPDLTQPLTLTAQIGNNPPAQATVQLDPPPIILIHGLWGDLTSLGVVETYLGSQAPWNALPAEFITPVQYTNDIAFDDPSIEVVITNAINSIVSRLTSAQIAVGRVDLIAHSMGGLVARHYSSLSTYKGTQNRQLGWFHQTITLNTPEAGSLLANFLVNNSNTAFSKKSGMEASFVKLLACPSSKKNPNKTLGECFAYLQQNVTEGAVASLEPGSTNIARLPSANIPNALWRAQSSTVLQGDSQTGDPSALVFYEDNLIAATCPGPSYCPSKTSTVPVIGDILTDVVNDAVVPLASQTSGCTAPCVSVTTSGLAHTTAPFQTLGQIGLNFNNVLNNSIVNGQILCWLGDVNPCGQLPASRLVPATNLTMGVADKTQIDTTLPMRSVSRLGIRLPDTLTMGVPFELRIRYPVDKISGIFVRELDTHHNGIKSFQVRLSATSDGQTTAAILPLTVGDTSFVINAYYRDGGSEVRELSADVKPPANRPTEFWADYILRRIGQHATIGAIVGSAGVLQPVVLFDSAPDHQVFLHGLAKFHVVPGQGDDVVAIQDNGTYLPLKPGRATVEVNFAGFTTRADMIVRPE
jgi:hypothetical protein